MAVNPERKTKLSDLTESCLGKWIWSVYCVWLDCWGDCLGRGHICWKWITRRFSPGKDLGAECCVWRIANTKAVSQKSLWHSQYTKSRPWAHGWSLGRKGRVGQNEAGDEGSSHIIWSLAGNSTLCAMFSYQDKGQYPQQNNEVEHSK